MLADAGGVVVGNDYHGYVFQSAGRLSASGLVYSSVHQKRHATVYVHKSMLIYIY